MSVFEELPLACNKVKPHACNGSMNPAGIMEGREGGGRRGGGGGEERGEGYSHESWSLSMDRVSLCYNYNSHTDNEIEQEPWIPHLQRRSSI